MRLALYEPDIPQNTGTILRLAACLGVPVDVIGPTGFDMTRPRAEAGRRSTTWPTSRSLGIRALPLSRGGAGHAASRLVLLTTHAATPYTDFAFRADDTLLLGRESAGVPEAVHAAADARLRIPDAGRACARSTWPSRRRWCWARLLRRPAASAQTEPPRPR